MSEREKMYAYINGTLTGDTSRYEAQTRELMAMHQMIVNGEEFEALLLMFCYGRAKGYRMARRAQG